MEFASLLMGFSFVAKLARDTDDLLNGCGWIRHHACLMVICSALTLSSVPCPATGDPSTSVGCANVAQGVAGDTWSLSFKMEPPLSGALSMFF